MGFHTPHTNEWSVVSAAVPSVELLHTDFWLMAEIEVRDVEWLARLFDNWPGWQTIFKSWEILQNAQTTNAKCPSRPNLIKIFGVVYNIKITCLVLVYVWRLCCCCSIAVCVCDMCDYRNITQVDVAHCSKQTTTFMINKSQIRLSIKRAPSWARPKWEILHRMRHSFGCVLFWLRDADKIHKEYLPRNGYCLRCVRG